MPGIATVSVMISTRNRAGYLRESAASVLAQSFTDFELILCDDASTDETPAVCRELDRMDRRVRTLRHEANLGMAGNWISGLEAARGRYFAKLDDDNRYMPRFLDRCVAALEAAPTASFVFTDEWVIDESGRRDLSLTEYHSRKFGRTGLPAGVCADTALIAVRQSPGINASVFDREALTSAGGFRRFAGDFSDCDLFLNLAGRGYRACYVPDRLCEYRWHAGMASGDFLLNRKKAELNITVLEAHAFHRRAERLRRQKLATGYTSLARIQLLQGEVRLARRSMARAIRLAPGRLRSILLVTFLCLPPSAIDWGTRRRYQTRLAVAR